MQNVLKIMLRIKILTAFSLTLLSCGTPKNLQSEKLISVQGSVFTHHPYCGGAYPTPEQEEGYMVIKPNAEFYLVGPSDEQSKTLFKTDEKGEFTLELTNGNYSVFSIDKLLPSDDFIKLHSPTSSNYVVKEKDCFTQWQSTPDFVIQATDSIQPIKKVYKYRCYVKDNPCIQYNGPVAP